MEIVVADIVLAGPANLHGFARGPGQQCCLNRVIRFGFATEAATQQSDMNHDFLNRHSQCLGHGALSCLGRLSAGPDLRRAGVQLCRGHGRLHGGMRQIRRAVAGGNSPGTGVQSLLHLAALAEYLAGLLHPLHQCIQVFIRVMGGVLAPLPTAIECGPAAHGGVGMPGDNGNPLQRIKPGCAGSAVNPYDIEHTGHCARGILIVSRQPPVQHRGSFNTGVDHARQVHIRPVGGVARGHVVQINDGNIFTDVAKLLPALQADITLRRQRLPRGDMGELSKTQHPAIAVVYRMQARPALGGGHTPLLRRGALQHQACGRTHLAHDVVEVANRAGAIRVLATVIGIGQTLDNPHPVPVRLHFIGHYLGQRSANTGTHFRAMGNDFNTAIGLNADKQVEPGARSFIEHPRRNRQRRHQGQATATDAG